MLWDFFKYLDGKEFVKENIYNTEATALYIIREITTTSKVKSLCLNSFIEYGSKKIASV